MTILNEIAPGVSARCNLTFFDIVQREREREKEKKIKRKRKRQD